MLNAEPQGIIRFNATGAIEEFRSSCQNNHHPRYRGKVVDHLTKTLIGIGKGDAPVYRAARFRVSAYGQILHLIDSNEEASVALLPYEGRQRVEHVSGVVAVDAPGEMNAM